MNDTTTTVGDQSEAIRAAIVAAPRINNAAIVGALARSGVVVTVWAVRWHRAALRREGAVAALKPNNGLAIRRATERHPGAAAPEVVRILATEGIEVTAAAVRKCRSRLGK